MYFCNSRKKINFSFLTLIVVLFALLSFATIANAATFTVTRSDNRDQTCNSGIDCSLREAVKAANVNSDDDTIVFAPNVTFITLGSLGEIVINNNGSLFINGNGANVLTISGNNATRIFQLSGANVTISGLTLTEGNGVGAGNDNGYGGAILARGGFLTLERVQVTGNNITNGAGGVYFNGGTHQIRNSTFSFNTANGGCGGFNIDGGGSLTVVNSTISGNSTFSNGGGLCVGGASGTTLQNVTIINNTASGGGGFYVASGTLTFNNTIVAGNTTTFLYPEIRFDGGTIISAGNNFVGDSANDSTNTNQPISYQASDIRDTPPKLGVLQNNGGTTPTHALLDGSPAINAGNNTNASSTDQRGFARIVGGIIDIGAFESATTCDFTINPTNQSIGSSGGNITVNITGAMSCSRTAVSNADWISVTDGNSGNGNGTVTLSVQANTGSARTGTVTIAGQTFTVNQSSGCTYTLTPTSVSISSNSATSSFNISSGSGCNYTATSNDSFITVTSETSGSGNGTVSYSVAMNIGPARIGTITAGGQIFTVNQASGCSFIINPTTQSFTSSGGNGSATVTTENGCTYSTLSNDSWITVTQGASGSGNGTVSFTVAANTGVARIGTLFIAGQTFTVTQAGYAKSRKRVRFF